MKVFSTCDCSEWMNFDTKNESIGGDKMRLGDYKILEKMDSGTMGDVFLGCHYQTQEKVVIKIIAHDLVKNSRAIARFQREIYQTIQLEHTNIVSGYTAGEYQGRLYYVMEHVNGCSVQKELLSLSFYNENKALRVALQIAKALKYAASFKIIHRDIKPGNILLTKDGTAKLCDLGLAKSFEDTNTHTITGTVLGTPQYMSPEQTRGEELDEQTDIFSLGSTLYHMLTGQPPFRGKDFIEIMANVQDTEAVGIKEWNPLVSDRTCALVAKMMEKERSKRYRSFQEVCAELENCISIKASSSVTAKYKKCYVPEYRETMLAKVALHNRIIGREQIEFCLQQQEQLFLIGISTLLEDIILENEFISLPQMNILKKTVNHFINGQFEQILRKISPNVITDSKKQFRFAILDYVEQDEKKRKVIYSKLQDILFKEEQKKILNIAIEYNLISKVQADKCWNIYSNKVVLSDYSPIINILTEKHFLHVNDSRFLLRAVRRSNMTNFSCQYFMNQKN